MWGPASRLCPRRVLSALAGAGRPGPWRPSAAARRLCPAWSLRGFSDSFLQPLPDLDFEECFAGEAFPGEARLVPPETKRYVSSRQLALTLARLLSGRKSKRGPLLLECNPGPGILTELLLESGVRVVALESEKAFIPHLESLGNDMNRNLQVVYCDFFKLDPKVCDTVKPPIMVSRTLFKSLGIKPRPWSEGVPFKIFAVLPIRHERKAIWKLMYHLYACNSIFKYGRVELYFFIGEKEYQKLMATPKTPDIYQVLSVVCQVACDIKLLHKEISELVEQEMCFIQLSPRKRLFTGNLTPVNFDVFFHMVRHCFGKPSASLLHHLRSLSPVDSMEILKEMKFSKTTKANKMFPHDFKQLFETIENMEYDDGCRWLYDDSMDDTML
ncbi:dimethyladenosine transferase 2, mitochondrial isoform 2-T2 [Thomomys bottae]